MDLCKVHVYHLHKNKERIQKFKETGDSRNIYQNKLDKTAFNVIWLIYFLRIWLKEQFLINYYVIKPLILLKIRNMMDVNVELH